MRTSTLPPDVELAMIDGLAYWREQAIANGHEMGVAEWWHSSAGPILASDCTRCAAFVHADYMGHAVAPSVLPSHVHQPCPGRGE